MRAGPRRLLSLLPLVIAVLPPSVAHGNAADKENRLVIEDNEEFKEKVLVVPLRQVFDAKRVDDRLAHAGKLLDKHPEIAWVIFEIDASSEAYEAGQKLGEFILESPKLKGKTTVAYIPANGRAFGAAVLPVIACREIALGENARLGAGDVVNPLVEDETRKIYSRVARKFASRRNRQQLLAGLMIDKAAERVFLLERKDDSVEAWRRYEFWTQNDLNVKNASDRAREFRPEKTFREKGSYVTLDRTTAFDYAWARHRGIVHDPQEYADLRMKLGHQGPALSVIHVDRGPLKRGDNALQVVIDVLNHPVSRFVLILFGFLGLFLEIKLLGTMVPGIIGITCFALFFTAGMFPVTGSLEPSATWFEGLLFLIGLGLVAVEFLLVPGVAVFGLAGSLLCLVSLVLAMVPGSDPAAGQPTFKEAFLTIGAGFGASGAAFLLALRYLPESRWLSRGIVNRAQIEGVPDADSATAADQGLGWIIGKTATAQTPLRPAGKIVLDDGKLLDVVADGEFIERGEEVVVRSCTSTRIVVARSEKTV